MLEQGRPYIDGVELRLDHFEKIDPGGFKAFIGSCGMPVMLTLRRKDQGGVFPGDEKVRLALLESLCALQPAYIDLEYDVPIEFRKKLFLKIILISRCLSSYHDFSQTPEDLDAVLSKMNTLYAHIYKIACTAKSTLDALRLLEFVQVQSQKKKIIGISMGEDGQCTRILAPVVGNYLTYASIIDGQSTAPGQITAKEMPWLSLPSAEQRRQKVYSLVGGLPVDKSLRSIIHNAVFENAKVNAVYIKL